MLLNACGDLIWSSSLQSFAKVQYEYLKTQILANVGKLLMDALLDRFANALMD